MTNTWRMGGRPVDGDVVPGDPDGLEVDEDVGRWVAAVDDGLEEQAAVIHATAARRITAGAARRKAGRAGRRVGMAEFYQAQVVVAPDPGAGTVGRRYRTPGGFP
jgi:hypothetical protein